VETSLNDSLDDTDLRHRRQTWDGFSDALARGVELVATPLLFGLGGWYLDRWAGTRPLFTLLLFLVAIVGMAARMYYAYMADMQEHDRAGVWARRPAPPASAAESGDPASAAESGDPASAAESGDRNE
jgi:F0F1-type ATP synthase assembly protein I